MTKETTQPSLLANRSKTRTQATDNETSDDSFVLPDWLPANPFSQSLNTPEKIAELHQQYSTNIPYKHIHIENLCNYNDMLAVRHDIIKNLSTVDRETDLFKVSQTIDLNNISLHSETARQLPNLLALRTHMYSPQFREFLEQVTGCGKLSDRVDCAANVYSSGSHLLTHDDVITTRKLSYIIYLSETPDEHESTSEDVAVKHEWNPSYGGALELYDAVPAPILPANATATAKCTMSNEFDEDSGPESESEPESSEKSKDVVAVKIPLPVPARVLPPTFNSMAVFEVKAGESFHAVQEVYSTVARRVSIQGWFHFAGPRPHNYDRGATLRLLQTPLLHPTYLPSRNSLPQAEIDENPDLLEKCRAGANLSPGEIETLVSDMCHPPSENIFINYSEAISNATQAQLPTAEEEDQVNNALMKLVKKHLVDVISTPKKSGDEDANAGDGDVDESLSQTSSLIHSWDDPAIIKQDLTYLRQFINPVYTIVGTIQQLSADFRRTGVLLLSNFLREDISSVLSKAIIHADVDLGLALKPDEDVVSEVRKNMFFTMSSPTCESFSPKVYPPDYTVGVSPVFMEKDTVKSNATQTQQCQSGQWLLSGPSFKRRTCIYRPVEYLDTNSMSAAEVFKSASPSEKAGILFHALQKYLFESTAFARLIQWFTSLTPVSQTTQVQRFRPGLDYTVGSYDQLLKSTDLPTISVTYVAVDVGQADFAENIWKKSTTEDLKPFEIYPEAEDDDIEGVDNEDEDDEDVIEEDEDEDDAEEDDAVNELNEQPVRDAVSDNNAKMTKKQSKRAMWASDDFGGFMAHIPVDQTTEGDQAEEYVEDTDAKIVSLSASNNTLAIVRKRKNTLSFVRYINGHAPGSRWEVSMETQCVVPENENEEDFEDFDEDGYFDEDMMEDMMEDDMLED